MSFYFFTFLFKLIHLLLFFVFLTVTKSVYLIWWEVYSSSIVLLFLKHIDNSRTLFYVKKSNSASIAGTKASQSQMGLKSTPKTNLLVFIIKKTAKVSSGSIRYLLHRQQHHWRFTAWQHLKRAVQISSTIHTTISVFIYLISNQAS